jgi:hypothetical protein
MSERGNERARGIAPARQQPEQRIETEAQVRTGNDELIVHQPRNEGDERIVFREARSPFGSTSSISIRGLSWTPWQPSLAPDRFDLQPRAAAAESFASRHITDQTREACSEHGARHKERLVKKKLLTTCAGTALSLFGCASEHSSSTQRLLSYDSSDADRQAQLLTGFDYSRHLQSAARKESAGCTLSFDSPIQMHS